MKVAASYRHLGPTVIGMKTKGRAPGRFSPIARAWPLALAIPCICLLACSSKSSGDNGVGGSGDAGAADVGADQGVSGLPIDPSLNLDPRDLDAVNGDPALDIGGSQLYFDKGAPWVRVVFYGAWPPPTTLYSWACSVVLGTQNAPVVNYTVQSLSGAARTTTVDGMDPAKITFAVEPRGFRVLFADATLAFDRYGLECDVQAKDPGAMAADTSGSFVVTAKVERAFGP